MNDGQQVYGMAGKLSMTHAHVHVDRGREGGTDTHTAAHGRNVVRLCTTQVTRCERDDMQLRVLSFRAPILVFATVLPQHRNLARFCARAFCASDSHSACSFFATSTTGCGSNPNCILFGMA